MRVDGVNLNLLNGKAIYEEVLLPILDRARRSIWVATANIKDVWVNPKGDYQPLTEILSRRAREGVEVRILHSGHPSVRFEKRLASCVGSDGIEVRVCLRNHLKCMICDGYELYLGTANLTGAGMGAKSDHRRNFEAGIATRDLRLTREIQRLFDSVWQKDHCRSCSMHGQCPTYEGGW